MANAARKVREIFLAESKPLTLRDIRSAVPELKASQISMSLCYFMRQRYMTREQIPNERNKGRKNVWLYTFHPVRLPAPAVTTATALPELSEGIQA